MKVPLTDDKFAVMTSFMIIAGDEKDAVAYLDNLKLQVE